MHYQTRSEKLIVVLVLLLIPAIALPLLSDPIIGIVLYLGCIGAAFILFNPILGLLLMIFFIPLEAITTFERTASMSKAIGFMTFFAWALHNIIMSRKPLKTSNIFFLLILFCMWAWASTLWSDYPRTSISRFINIAQLIVLYFLMLNLIDTEKRFKMILTAYVSGCFVCGLLATQTALTTGILSGGSSRMALEGQNPNTMGVMMTFGILFSWYIFSIIKSYILRLIVLFASMIFFYALIMSQSRGAWIAFAIALCFYCWPMIKKVNPRTFLTFTVIIFSIITAIVLLPLLFPQQFTSFQERLFSISESGSLTKRPDIWRVGFEMWKDNPILGVGLNNFTREFNQYRDITYDLAHFPGYKRDPHNVYLSIICELGLVGFAIFSAILYSSFIAIIKNKPLMKYFLLSAFVILLITSLKGTVVWNKYYWLILGLIGTRLNFSNQSDELPHRIA